MEQYYFLQKNGNSQGPYRLVDLKKQAIQADDLVWRNNTNEWVKASDLEELSDIIIIKAPSVLKMNINITELYYFIQQEGTKKGPFKLPELKELTIYFDELVWRSDSDQWKKASEFEELSGIFIIKPPPTPKEQKIAEVNRNFTGKIIGQLAISYFIVSFLIGFISFGIAQASWDKYLKDTGGKYLGNNYRSQSSSSFSSPFSVITAAELYDNRRYKLYFSGENNESKYGYGQGFWFRPFKAFGSTIYLTLEEQKNSILLMGHLILSSFASLSFIFMIIGIIYYAIKRTDLADKPANTESIN